MSGQLPTDLRAVLTACLLGLALLVVGCNSSAFAAEHRHGNHGASAHAAADAAPVETVVTAASVEDGYRHSGHHGANLACCEGTACLSMHAGLLATPLLPQPPGAASSAWAGTDRLADGLGIAPALPPPRRPV